MKDPAGKFEEALHRYELKGLEKKIKKATQQNISKLRLKARRKRQVLQQQITLVLLVFTLLWLIVLIFILSS